VADTPLTQEAVQAALRDVLVPGTTRDIVSIDLVGEVAVDDGDVVVEIVQTSEKDETIAAIQEAVGDMLSKLAGVSSVRVNIRRPEPVESHGHHHGGAEEPAPPEPLAGVERIIAVASAKGGVGKSSVAVNLALALKERGHRVGLLDADVYGPSIPSMLGCTEQPKITPEKKVLPVEVLGMQMMSMGLMVPPDQAVIWRGPMVFAAVKQFLHDVAWHDLDYLVVDMPPGTGDAQLTLVQQVPLNGVVMVTTPQEIALTDVRRGIQMFKSVRVPVLGVVENMSYFLCPDNGKEYDLFGRGGGKQVADQFRLPLLGEIPIEPTIREGGDNGKPAMVNSESPARGAFLTLANQVHELSGQSA